MTATMDSRSERTDPVLARAGMIGLNLMVGDVDRAASFYADLLGVPPGSDAGSGPAFDLGQSALWLTPRRGPAPPARDGTAMPTFMVPDIVAAGAALGSRGVTVGEVARYEIGATADLQDPDGHALALYEPSADALTWPSGAKLRSISNGRATATLVYLFLFVPDAEAAYGFYHDELGLPDLERSPCRRGSIDHQQGVVKYDVGGLLLTTHLVRGADDSEAGRAVRDPRFLSEWVPVFGSDDLDAVAASLRQRGIAASASGRSPRREVSFTDPFGRPFLVRETASALEPPADDGKSGNALSGVS